MPQRMRHERSIGTEIEHACGRSLPACHPPGPRAAHPSDPGPNGGPDPSPLSRDRYGMGTGTGVGTMVNTRVLQSLSACLTTVTRISHPSSGSILEAANVDNIPHKSRPRTPRQQAGGGERVPPAIPVDLPSIHTASDLTRRPVSQGSKPLRRIGADPIGEHWTQRHNAGSLFLPRGYPCAHLLGKPPRDRRNRVRTEESVEC